MARCVHCGRQGLLLFVDENEHCRSCAKQFREHSYTNGMQRYENDLNKAAYFLDEVSSLLIRIPDSLLNSGFSLCNFKLKHTPVYERAEIRAITEKLIILLPAWKDYIEIEDAFRNSCVPHDQLKSCLEHPVIHTAPIGTHHEAINFDEIFGTLLAELKTLHSSLVFIGSEDYLSLLVGRIPNGIAHENQQTMFRKIYKCEPPYEDDPDIRVEKITYKGQTVFLVYINDKLGGSISESDTQAVLTRWSRYYDIPDFEIGTIDDDSREYGLRITMRFHGE